MADTTYNVGIYCRLSNDDERDGESVSIENQRLLLQQYVRDRGWNEIDTYIDDGYSGANFQRPGVQRLIADAKAGRINVILVKDLCDIVFNGPIYGFSIVRITSDIFEGSLHFGFLLRKLLAVRVSRIDTSGFLSFANFGLRDTVAINSLGVGAPAADVGVTGRQAILAQIVRLKDKERHSRAASCEQELKVTAARVAELEKLMQSLYEDI